MKILYFQPLYISSEAVIPAPYPVVGSNRQVRGKLQRESSSEILESPCIEYGAGSVKPGMTVKVNPVRKKEAFAPSFQ